MWLYLTVGFFSYFFALPVANLVPGTAALISPLGSLLLLGVVLAVYSAAQLRDRRRLLVVLLVLPMFPASTLLLGGFLGFGTAWMIFGAAVVYVFWPKRTVFLVAAPIVAYIGLSLFPAYSSVRDEFRDVAWQAGGGMRERMEVLSGIGALMKPYDIDDPEQTWPVDQRLNQNVLVANAIEWHELNYYPLYLGTTVPLWSLIPRAVWPEKPTVGGGLDLIAETTGLEYDDGTSVGTGHVLELYINFGWTGVILGFAVLGFALSRVDRVFVDSIRGQDYRRMTAFGLAAVPVLAAGGNGMEILVAMVAGVVVGNGVGLVLEVYILRNRVRFERKDSIPGVSHR
jgi:hypothetical protein